MKNRNSKVKTLSALFIIAVAVFAIASCQKSNLSPATSDQSSSITENKVIETPDVPDVIAVPEGNKVIWHSYATGVQIYQVTQSTSDPDVYLWTFIAPSATLYKKANFTKQVGTHYVGPTWKATTGPKNGEFVVGTKLSSYTDDVTAIPWLLLQAVASNDPNYYSEITYIQRLYTAGGLAPTTGATAENLGIQDSIPYTAEYFFYGAE